MCFLNIIHTLRYKIKEECKKTVCSICEQPLCPIGCPGYSEKGIYQCGACEDGICDGESYYKIGKTYFHRECLLECYDKDELLTLFGAIPRVATNCKVVFLGGIKNERKNLQSKEGFKGA